MTLQVSRNIRSLLSKFAPLGFTWQIPVIHKFTRLETVIDRLRREITELQPDISLTKQDVERLKQERTEEIMMLSLLNDEVSQ